MITARELLDEVMEFAQCDGYCPAFDPLGCGNGKKCDCGFHELSARIDNFLDEGDGYEH